MMSGQVTRILSEDYDLDKGGRLEGPYVALQNQQFRFFSYTFDSQSPVRCYWAFEFYEEPAKKMVRDIYGSVYPSADPVRNSTVIYIGLGANGLRPLFQSEHPLHIRNLRLEEITPLEAAEWCDDLYTTLPPLDYLPPKGRLSHIPKTMAALQSGTPWRILILGHSLFNDTYNSNFQALLLRAFPRATLEVVWSGRGATGCDYYQDHIEDYVTEYRPNLLIIGGVVNGYGLEPIRSVINQARQQLNCEMILMTEPFGWDIRPHQENDFTTPLPKQTLDPDAFFREWFKESYDSGKLKIGPMEFVEQQRQLADSEEIAFLDAKTAWYTYLGNSGTPWQWFQRDAAHASDRGKQVVARMIERFFTAPEE